MLASRGSLDDPELPDHSTSSDEEHFSDASEGKFPDRDVGERPEHVPTTRVERIDSRPNFGEVPGSAVHHIKTKYAELDDVESVHEGPTRTQPERTEGGASPAITSQAPKTMVEKIDPDDPSFGEVPGTDVLKICKADAQPNVVRGRHASSASLKEPNTDDEGTSYLEAGQATTGSEPMDRAQDDIISDDFDDFEAGNVEDDFGAFDEVSQPSSATTEPYYVPSTSGPESFADLVKQPLLDFDGLDNIDDLVAACNPYIEQIFPNLGGLNNSITAELPEADGSLLTERSQSLWSQLIAPPPIAPPNWIRSRIRRLFLVSLGVPVDLDEILPASKQKKLILPSIETGSPEPQANNSQSRRNGTVTRLKDDNNSSTSVNSSGSKSERRRKGPPPPPELDIISTRLLCSTTTIALESFTDEELENHVARLEELKRKADEVLDYWSLRKDNAIGEKNAFEEVIENFVKHAKKIRR